MDIYLNYDCDLSLANIFERLINVLSRVAQSGGSHQPHSSDVEISMPDRMLCSVAVACIGNVLKCMVEWCRDLYVNPNSTGMMAFGIAKSVQSTAALLEATVDAEHLRVDSGGGVVGDGDGSGPSTPRGHRRVVSLAATDGGVVESGSLVSGSLSSDAPEEFEERKQRKALMEKGLAM